MLDRVSTDGVLALFTCLLPRRRGLFAAPQFFNLTSYELVLKDIRHMQDLRPDMIILDEAQRIRNWTHAQLNG